MFILSSWVSTQHLKPGLKRWVFTCTGAVKTFIEDFLVRSIFRSHTLYFTRLIFLFEYPTFIFIIYLFIPVIFIIYLFIPLQS